MVRLRVFLARLKLDFGKQITSVAVEPVESPVISQTLAGEESKTRPTQNSRYRCGFHSQKFRFIIIDRVETVDSDTARHSSSLNGGRRHSCRYFIWCSCRGCRSAAKLPEFADKLIVVILPSASERYLSTALFEGIEG